MKLTLDRAHEAAGVLAQAGVVRLECQEPGGAPVRTLHARATDLPSELRQARPGTRWTGSDARGGCWTICREIDGLRVHGPDDQDLAKPEGAGGMSR